MHALILSLAAALVAASVAIRVANRRRAKSIAPTEANRVALASALDLPSNVQPLHPNRRKSC